MSRPVAPVTTPRHRAPALLRVAALLAAMLLAAACGDTPRGSADPATPPDPLIAPTDIGLGSPGEPLGDYTPQSSVVLEVRAATAIAQIDALLDPALPVDWDAIREAVEAAPAPIAGVSPPSLVALAIPLGASPTGGAYARHFDDTEWLATRIVAAAAGTGPFDGADDPTRAAALHGALAIELPIVQALIAAERAERLTAAGDLDPILGAPYEWDRVWAILHGAPGLLDRLEIRDHVLTTTAAGYAAAASGDLPAARAATDSLREHLVLGALRGMLDAAEGPTGADTGSSVTATRLRLESLAYLRSVEPLLARLDPAATADLLAHLRSPTPSPEDRERIAAAAEHLATLAGIEASLQLPL